MNPEEVEKKTTESEFKDCPICGEIIKQKALKCIRCGEYLDIPNHRTGVWPAWTGFNGRTLWEWLTILVIPLALGIAGVWYTEYQESQRESAEIAARQTEQVLQATFAAGTAVAAEEQATATAQVRVVTLEAQQTLQAERNILATQEALSRAAVQTAQARGTQAALNSQATLDAAQNALTRVAVRSEATEQAEREATAVRGTEVAEATRAVQALAAVRATAESEEIAMSIAQATSEAGQTEATVQAVQQQAQQIATTIGETPATAIGPTAPIITPTATSPASPTLAPTPSVTLTPTQTPTPTLVVSPTATLTPTVSVSLTETAAACEVAARHPELRATYGERLGCPQPVITATLQWQQFANGTVLRLPERYLVALGATSGEWQTVPADTLPDPVCVELNPLLTAPFTRLWCPPYDAGSYLGAPQAAAQTTELTYQPYANGSVLQVAETVYIFLDTGNRFEVVE